MNELMAQKIQSLLIEDTLLDLDALETFDEIESTNSYLLKQSRPPIGKFRVALADHQTASRGQFGRHWFSGPAAGIYLSVSYSFAEKSRNLPCLTLAVGVGITKALAALQFSGISLKWPNDLIVNGRKAGGILTEVVPGQSDFATVVIGVGLNVDLRAIPTDSSRSSWFGGATDLRSCHPQLPEKSTIVAALVNGLYQTLCQFGQQGFRPFFQSWDAVDWLRGKQADIMRADNSLSGTVMGIDHQGQLLLATATGMESVVSGSVRLLEQRNAE